MRQSFKSLCLALVGAFVAVTAFAEGENVTFRLKNADMEQGLKYWALDGSQLLTKNTKEVDKVIGFHGMDRGVLEVWNNRRHYDSTGGYAFVPVGNSRTMQQVSNLPNGTYVFGAYAAASQQNTRNWETDEFWSNRDSIYGVSLFANNDEVAIATENPDWGGYRKWIHSSKFNVATTVTDGTLQVGLKVEETNANYVVWDNATLYYFGDMSEAEALDLMAEIDMEKAVEIADTLTNVHMNLDTLYGLHCAIKRAVENTTIAATLWDDSEDLYWNMGLARKSQSDYASLKKSLDFAKVVAEGEWRDEYKDFYYDNLTYAIEDAQYAYDAQDADRAELTKLRADLDKYAGLMRLDSVAIALDALNTFLREGAFTNLPGEYSVVQQNVLKAFAMELGDTLWAVENPENENPRPQDLYPYIAEVYAAIENVKNNPIPLEYTQMPIEFKRSATPIEGYCYIEGAELNAEGLIAFASPLYRFENTIETFRITVNSAANNQSYFCLSELAVYDGSGNRIWLTEDDVTSNADHNALNPNRQDGGGIPALFDEDTNTYFHSTWLAGSSDGGAHYLEITLPDGGYDAFSFQMIARAPQSAGVYNQNYTFPGEMVISTPAPEREALEVWIGAAKNLNPYSFPEVGFYEYDHSYLTEAIAKAEALIANNPSEEECREMNVELREAVLAFEANENKAIRLPEPGKAYRIVSAFPGFFEKQGVEKTVTINEELQTLWWEDVQIDKSLQEFVFEPVLDENGEQYIEIESGENWDGTIYEEVYYCYYVKNVATGLYMGDVVDYSFGLSEEPTSIARLKCLGRGQWNIEVRDYNEEFDSYMGGIMHAGDHNGGNPSTNSGNYGGTSGISSGLVPYSGSIDSQSAWFIREYQSLPYDLMAVAGEYKSDLIRFEASNFFTLTADKACAFANLKLYDMYGSEIAIDNLVISGNTATIRQESRLAAFSFAFTNNEGVSSVVVDMNKASEALEVLRVVYEAGLSLNPQEGTGVMQYADISAYTAAMARAEAMLATGASDEDVRAMLAELDEAIVSLVPNMPVPGRMYYIVSAMDAFVVNHGVGMMIYADQDGNANWAYENLYNLNRCWLFEPAENEEGYYIRNVGTGMYLGYETYSSAYELFMVGSKVETIPYTITSLGGDAVAIAASINESSRLHAKGHSNGAGISGNICYWPSGAGTASAWRICEAEPYGLEVLNTYEMKAQDVEARSTSIVNLPIEMVNAAAVVAFQFDLYLPEGISVAKVSLNGERASDDYVLSVEPLDSGTWRVMAYSSENSAFMGNDGVLVNVAMAIDNIANGDYKIFASNILLETVYGTEEWASDYSSVLTIGNTLLGDVNGDGQYTMSDVVMMVNAVLEKPQATFNASAADMNGDGAITMGDVVSVLRLVLTDGEAMSPARRAQCNAVTLPELSALDFVALGEGRLALPVTLKNSEAYSAFQLDLVLPAGVELAEATLTNRAKTSHSVAWNTLADGSVRIVAYALDNATFRGNDGELLNLVLNTTDNLSADAEVVLANGLFAMGNGSEHSAAELSVMMRSETTGICEAHTAAFRVYGEENAVVIECGVDATVSIYAATGKLVLQTAVKAGKNTIALPAGVYVVNNNKVIVK